MERKQQTWSVLALACAVAMFAACDKAETRETAKLNVRLTDAPGNYDAVYVDVQGVEIHTEEGGWASMVPIVPGVYNLLDFRNGIDTLLCTAELPAGQVSQMRLVLGDDNSVVVDGQTLPLTTPSAQQSGLKFNVHQALEPNGSYNLWIDFDVARSIVATGSGAYNLKPVIRTFTELTDGRIKGYVEPVSANPVVYVFNETDTASAIPDDSGMFLFCGMPEGTYTLTVEPDEASGLAVYERTGVPVAFGITSDLGTITLIAEAE